MGLSRDLQILLGSDGNVAALERLYDRTIERILRELAAGVSRPGAARARETLIRIRELASELNPRRDSLVRDWIRRELPKAFILGDRDAAKDVARALADAGVERIGNVQVNRAFSPVNNTALQAMVATMTMRLEGVHRQILETAGLVVRNTQLRAQTNQEIREHVVDGIIRGSTGREVSNDIAKAILGKTLGPEEVKRLRAAGHAGDLALYGQLSKGQFITVGKRRMDVRAYANLVARSMSREAAAVATKVRLQQSGVEHVQVSDTRPTKPDVCSLILGRVYYIGSGEDPLGFPHINEIPGGTFPPHPHCRHVLWPYVAALKNRGQIDRARQDADLLPDRFFGKSTAEVEQLIHAMDDQELRRIAPAAFDPEPQPPTSPREAA